jgi:hypothetical protein
VTVRRGDPRGRIVIEPSAHTGPEPWLDKRGLAQHLSCSVRSIEHAVAGGLPHAVIFGRVKFQVPTVEAWLEHHGHLIRREGHADTVHDDN